MITIMDVVDRELDRLHARLVHVETNDERYFIESQIAKLISALAEGTTIYSEEPT
jgi:hypothetical protein